MQQHHNLLFRAVFAAVLAVFVNYAAVFGQNAPKENRLAFSIFNLGTQLPGSGTAGVFTLPVHLGASVGAEFRYDRRAKNQWFQTAKLAFAHHRYVQRALVLHTEIGYRRAIWRGTSAELRLGGGYLHSFPDTQVFELNGSGQYDQKAALGRPQGMAGGALGLGYLLPKPAFPMRLFIDYQFFLQMPFVKQYVTLLPNAALHVGASLPFSTLKK